MSEVEVNSTLCYNVEMQKVRSIRFGSHTVSVDIPDDLRTLISESAKRRFLNFNAEVVRICATRLGIDERDDERILERVKKYAPPSVRSKGKRRLTSTGIKQLLREYFENQ